MRIRLDLIILVFMVRCVLTNLELQLSARRPLASTVFFVFHEEQSSVD